MINRDYLVRLIRQAGAALARALDLVDTQQEDEAESEINGLFQRITKLPRDQIEKLDTATVGNMIEEPERLRLLAQTWRAAGELHAQRGEPKQARTCYRKAMELYAQVGLGERPADAAAARRLAELGGS